MKSPTKSMRQKVAAWRERWIDSITSFIVDKPKTLLCLTVGFFVVAMVLVIAVGTRTTTPSEYEWELPYDKFSKRRDMIYEAEDDVDAGLLPERSDQTFPFYFFYDSKPRNGPNTCHEPGLLKPRNVQTMCKAEQQFWGREKYQTYCLNPPCRAPEQSIVRLLYGESSDTLLNESNFFDCPLPTTVHWPVDSFYVDSEAFERGWPCRARSLAYIATPLEGYDEVSTWDDAQFRKIQKRFVNRVESDLISKYNMKPKPLRSVYLEEARDGISGEKFEILWWNPYLEESQFVEAVDSDFMFAICSILFVWVWICVHTNSFFIGSCSMLQILFSLPLSLFFYRVVLQIRYLSIMQNLVVFVILGIGADDVFVYHDAWLQSSGSIKERVKYAYTRAFQSIFNTSFTTAVAFFATAIAELVPIASFGIFAAICVIMNFALVLTVTPCVTILHQRWFGDQKVKEEKPSKWLKMYLKMIMSGKDNKDELIEAALQNDIKPTSTTHKKPIALLFVLLLSAYGAMSATFASRLKPPSEQEVWFASAHMATKVDKLQENGYGSNDANFYPLLSIVWGMDKIKRNNFDPYVPHRARGDLKLSNRFDLSLTEAQNQVLYACGNLTIYPCESGCVDENLVRPNSTVCFLQEFQQWHWNEYGVSTYDLGKEVFDSRLSTFRDTTTPLSEDYASWKDLIGYVDGELRFFRLDTRISVDIEEPVVKKKQVLRRTNRFVSRFCRNLDTELPDVWQYSNVWIWYKTQRALVRGLLIGMAIAFPVALITLIGATQNIILATFAILTIGCIVSSVLGLAYMLGWALGIKESVAGVVVIGLSVDYTIHMGHMFDHARLEKGLEGRDDKFIFALVSMGPTIIAGAVTTAGSAIFLIAAQLTFFTQMGILILSTIGYSLVFSLFFYMPLLYIAGPEGNFGNLSAIKHGIQDCFSARVVSREVELIEEQPKPTSEDDEDDTTR